MALLAILVPLLFLALVRFLDGSTARSLHRARFLGWLGQSTLWHVLVALALSALMFSAFLSHGPSSAPFFLIVLVLLALFFWGWRHEFLFLMSLPDEAFPGRHDKLVWMLLLVLLPPLGFWTFRAFRVAHWPEPATGPVEAKPVREMV